MARCETSLCGFRNGKPLYRPKRGKHFSKYACSPCRNKAGWSWWSLEGYESLAPVPGQDGGNRGLNFSKGRRIKIVKIGTHPNPPRWTKSLTLSNKSKNRMSVRPTLFTTYPRLSTSLGFSPQTKAERCLRIAKLKDHFVWGASHLRFFGQGYNRRYILFLSLSFGKQKNPFPSWNRTPSNFFIKSQLTPLNQYTELLLHWVVSSKFFPYGPHHKPFVLQEISKRYG